MGPRTYQAARRLRPRAAASKLEPCILSHVACSLTPPERQSERRALLVAVSESPSSFAIIHSLMAIRPRPPSCAFTLPTLRSSRRRRLMQWQSGETLGTARYVAMCICINVFAFDTAGGHVTADLAVASNPSIRTIRSVLMCCTMRCHAIRRGAPCAYAICRVCRERCRSKIEAEQQ